MPEVGGGLLLVLAEPREGMDEEFERWYEDEHLYERCAIEGFTVARRYIAIEGRPRSIALYEAKRAEDIGGEAYERARKHEADSRVAENEARAAGSRSGASRPPILDSSQRMDFSRHEHALVQSVGRHPGEMGAFIWMVREQTDAEHDAQLNDWYAHEHLPAVTAIGQVRGVKRYRARTDAPTYLTLYELATAGVVKSDAWKRAFETPSAAALRPHVTNISTHLAQFFKVVDHEDATREMAERLSDWSERP